MRPSIFVRMVIGYLAIFVPVVAVSAYAFSQLALFRKVTASILEIDNRTKDLGQKLVDSILAQARYERKFIIMKDKELYNQFMVSETDINDRMEEAISIADTAHKKEILIKIKDYYERYKNIFNEEAEFTDRKQTYFQAVYREKKEKAIDEILWGLRNLKLYAEQDTYEKIRQLGEFAGKANRIAVVMGAGFILSGIVISIFITRSITTPLSLMRKKTRQVAGGDFEGNLDLSNPPEVADLAEDFNLMCSRLRETDKMKSDFFSLMAHELRTPLASIREGTNLLLNGISEEFKEKRKEVLRIIAEESHRLSDLVNSLLDLSKMEAGMITLNFETSDIKPLITKAASGIEPLAMARDMSIKVEIPGDLPHLRMDKDRILQALRNLMGNAVKFTPGGGQITISAQALEDGVRVSIADTGPGIPKEDLSVIFDKFRQATMTSCIRIEGTGLGLAIVKHVIEAHGGKVWAESEIGYGSTFTFQLPASSPYRSPVVLR